MDRRTLIDAVICQTTVMIAQLATSGGHRTPLTHLANQIFLDLSRQLRAHKLGSKVIADMFGLTLRAYNLKLKRLRGTETGKGKSLWQDVVSFLTSNETVTRSELVRRFQFDDQVMVAGIVNDLVESGLVFRSGRGATAVYRASIHPPENSDEQDSESLDMFLWLLIFRLGPIGLNEIHERFPTLDKKKMLEALNRLIDNNRVQSLPKDPSVFQSHECILGLDQKEGWEAAIFDHFQAMANVVASCTKNRSPAERDIVGGSTFHYDIDETHPLQEEVLRFFSQVRQQGSDLRRRVDEYNRKRNGPPHRPYRVAFYAGQNVIAEVSPEDNCKQGRQ